MTDTATEAQPDPQVRMLQQFLRGGGWYQGPDTGVLDDATYTALVAFQEERGIGASGQLDLATQAEMDRVIRYVSRGPETDIDRKVRELYGAGLGAYLSHPEVGPILRWAAAEGASIERLEGYLQRTQWWQQQSESSRNWDLTAVEDPATANQRRSDRTNEIVDLAGQLGVTIDQRTLRDLTEDSLRYGQTPQEIQDLLVSLATFDADSGPEGELGAIVDRLRQVARSYYLSPDDRELFDQAQRILSGTLTEDGAILNFRNQAKTNHPFLSEAIDQGTTVADYFAEHRRRVAAALEIPEDSIDFMNDQRFWPILGFVDGKGQRRPMTWSETLAHVNQFPEADATQRLRNESLELGTLIQREMRGF